MANEIRVAVMRCGTEDVNFTPSQPHQSKFERQPKGSKSMILPWQRTLHKLTVLTLSPLRPFGDATENYPAIDCLNLQSHVKRQNASILL